MDIAKTANSDSEEEQDPIMSEEQHKMWDKIDELLKEYYLTPF